MTLKEFLMERGIAQRSLARRLGMSSSQFHDSLSGKRPWSEHAVRHLPMILPKDTPVELLLQIRESRKTPDFRYGNAYKPKE